MCTEMNKAVPNTAVIDDRMTRTLALRRLSVIDTPLLELLDKFPALKLDDQVHKVNIMWICQLSPIICEFLYIFYMVWVRHGYCSMDAGKYRCTCRVRLAKMAYPHSLNTDIFLCVYQWYFSSQINFSFSLYFILYSEFLFYLVLVFLDQW